MKHRTVRIPGHDLKLPRKTYCLPALFIPGPQLCTIPALWKSGDKVVSVGLHGCSLQLLLEAGGHSAHNFHPRGPFPLIK
jgi:hypothetical protein